MLEIDFVSCIMPTHNRRAFVPRAIEYFLHQDYERKELLVLDDGEDKVEDLIPPDPRIRYVRLDKRLSLGAKRNRACELAKGDLIAHWDDDDWHAPERLSCQVEALLKEDADVCGMRQLLFVELESHQTWLYSYPTTQRGWVAGGSMVYKRSFWQTNPFPEIQVGEDTRFLWNKKARVAVISRLDLYVASIHDNNTSRRNCRGAYWSRWQGNLAELTRGDLATIIKENGAFYPGNNGGKGMRLNLGCCDRLLEGFVNVDVIPGEGVEVADLRQPWPWPENSVEEVRAWDIIEHLPDKMHTMNELWRVLRSGGTAEIAVPTTEGSGAFQDPTHVSFWNRRSFLYYEAGNPYRERFAHHYGIKAKFRVVRERSEQTLDGPRLTIVLEAVKP